ncbi:hypothetical protein Tco_1302364 [Tanacetum coccineum]
MLSNARNKLRFQRRQSCGSICHGKITMENNQGKTIAEKQLARGNVVAGNAIQPRMSKAKENSGFRLLHGTDRTNASWRMALQYWIKNSHCFHSERTGYQLFEDDVDDSPRMIWHQISPTMNEDGPSYDSEYYRLRLQDQIPLVDHMYVYHEFVEEAKVVKCREADLESKGKTVRYCLEQRPRRFGTATGKLFANVAQFCDYDLKLHFRKHSCFVRDINGADILKGSRSTNLYTISIDEMMKSSPICLLSKASKSKSWL